MKLMPIAGFDLLALAGCSGKIESATNVTAAGATLNARLKRILLASVACFALACTSAQAQDMALNKSASASSTEGNRTDLRPALANDGSSSTRWSSNYVDNQWWQVDLGSDRQINRVELNWETAYASRYRIRTRTSSGNSWSTAATVTISSAGLRVDTFPVRTARYVRIQGGQRATPWGISLWDVRVFGPTPSPPPTEPPPPPPPPPPGTPTLQQVDGGTNYYAQFSNPLPTSPDYFPIGTWGSYNTTQANRDLDAAAGLNVYVWLADPCGTGQQVRGDSRFRVIYSQGENRSCIGTESAGWLTEDELDMRCGPPGCDGYTQLENTIRGMNCQTRCTDGRFLYANYGKGIAGPQWETDAQAQRWVNGTPAFGRYQDVVSNDIYWFTDPNGDVANTPLAKRASSYGATVDRMRFLDAMNGSSRIPIWNFVETGWAFTESAAAGGRSITGPEIRGAVWHSLIAGARGIIYFQHSFGGPHAGDHHTIRSNSEGTRPAVVAVNAQVKSLAPVLNAPTADGLVESSPGLRTMAKWQGGKFWVFAGRTQNGGSTSNTISLPCVGNATAMVDGESRSVPVTNGTLTDTFADGNAIHIYRIDGGSTCGLP